MRIRIHCIVLSVGWLMVSAPRQAAIAEPVEAEIKKLLSEATSTRTEAEAYGKLDYAKHLLAEKGNTTDELGRAFLEIDIRQAQGQINIRLWQQDKSKTSLRHEGRRALAKTADDYGLLVEKCEDRADKLESRLTEAQLAKSKEWKKVCGYVSRGNYARAWTQFVLGVGSSTQPEREAHLNGALKGFMDFTANGYRNHPIVADCFIGQALCLCELGHYFDATQLLDNEKITPGNTTAAIFKRISSIRVKAYQAMLSHLMAEDSANQYFDTLAEDHKLDAIELEMAVAQARSLSILATHRKENPYYRIHRSRLDEVCKLIYSYGEPWRSKVAKEIGETGEGGAFMRLVKAREHFSAAQFEQALEEAEAGLELSGQQDGQESVSVDLRYIKIATLWNLNRWPEAHSAAVDFLQKYPKGRHAVEARTIAIQSGLKGLKSEPPLDAALFVQFLEFAEKSFPDVPEVSKAPWYRANLLLQDGRLSEAEMILRAVGPNSPVYRHAQYGLALASFRKVESVADSNSTDTTRLLARTVAKLDRFAEAGSGTVQPQDAALNKAAIELAAVTADRLLRLELRDPNAVLSFIGRMEELQSVSGQPKHRLLGVRIEAEILAGNLDSALRSIDVLVRHNMTEPYVIRACINLANTLDQGHTRMVRNGKHADAVRIDEKQVIIYDFLVDRIRASKLKVVRDQEVPIRHRLARCLLRLERPRKAIGHYEWLVKNVPQEKAGYAIRGLAKAYEEINRCDLANQQWRRLYEGLAVKTEGWIEAGYHLIQCYIKTGRPEVGRKFLAHLKLRCSRAELGAWREKVTALEARLSSNSNQGRPVVHRKENP